MHAQDQSARTFEMESILTSKMKKYR